MSLPFGNAATDAVKRAMEAAGVEVKRFNHVYVGTEHILLGIIRDETNAGSVILQSLNLDLRKIRLETEEIMRADPDDAVTLGDIPLTPRAKKVVEYAIEEAGLLKYGLVGTPHLLLGIMREHDGVAAQVLMDLDVKLEVIRASLLQRFPKMDDVMNEKASEVPESEIAAKAKAAAEASATSQEPFSSFVWQQREAKERLADLLNRKRIPSSVQEQLQIVQIHATLALGAVLNDLDRTLKGVMTELAKE